MSTEDMLNIQDGNNNDIDSCLIIEECLEFLNKEELNVIMDIYFNNKTTREIGAANGVAASTICRVKQKALNKMRDRSEMGVK